MLTKVAVILEILTDGKLQSLRLENMFKTRLMRIFEVELKVESVYFLG